MTYSISTIKPVNWAQVPICKKMAAKSAPYYYYYSNNNNNNIRKNNLPSGGEIEI